MLPSCSRGRGEPASATGPKATRHRTSGRLGQGARAQGAGRAGGEPRGTGAAPPSSQGLWTNSIFEPKRASGTILSQLFHCANEETEAGRGTGLSPIPGAHLYKARCPASARGVPTSRGPHHAPSWGCNSIFVPGVAEGWTGGWRLTVPSACHAFAALSPEPRMLAPSCASFHPRGPVWPRHPGPRPFGSVKPPRESGAGRPRPALLSAPSLPARARAVVGGLGPDGWR